MGSIKSVKSHMLEGTSLSSSGIKTTMNSTNVGNKGSGMAMHNYSGTGMPTPKSGSGIVGPGTKDAMPFKRAGK